MPNKSLYIFLTALLGALLFLILHRILVFVYLYLIAAGYIVVDLSSRDFFTAEYFSLIIALMMGVWYGIWLGLSWFGKVYEEKSHIGFVHHLAANVFSDNNEKLRAMLAVAKERLEADAVQMEELALAAADQAGEQALEAEPAAPEQVKKKRVVRRRAPKKKILPQNPQTL